MNSLGHLVLAPSATTAHSQRTRPIGTQLAPVFQMFGGASPELPLAKALPEFVRAEGDPDPIVRPPGVDETRLPPQLSFHFDPFVECTLPPLRSRNTRTHGQPCCQVNSVRAGRELDIFLIKRQRLPAASDRTPCSAGADGGAIGGDAVRF